MSQTYNIEAILSAQDNGFSQVLNQVQELIEGVFSSIGRLSTLNTFFTTLRNSTTPLGNAFADLKLYFMGLGENSAGVITKLGILKGAFGKILLPIAAVIAAIGGLILWWNDLGERNADLQESFLNAWEMISGFVNRAVERVSQSFGRLLESLSGLWNAIAPLVDLIITIIAVVLAGVFMAIVEIISTAVAIITDVVSGLVNIVTGVIDVIVGLFTFDLERVIDGASRIFGGLLDSVGAIIAGIIGIFTAMPGDVYDGLRGVIDKVIEWGNNLIQSGIEAARDFRAGVLEFFTSLPGQIMDALKGLGSMLADFFSNLPGVGLIRRLFGGSASMATVGGELMGGLVSGMSHGVKGVVDVLANTLDLIEHGVDQASQMAAEFQRSLAHGSVTHQLALATTSPDASYQTDLMEKLIETVAAGQTIVMDSGELVGATYAGYDAAAGTAISYKSRWGR